MGKIKEEVVHDLFSRPVKPIGNWKEWLERWQLAVTLEEMESLLHWGFKAPFEGYGYHDTKHTEVDRLRFYFTIADGWKDNNLLRRGSRLGESVYEVGRDDCGNMCHKTESELRQRVAGKAFDMLCHNFFKLERHHGRHGFEGDWERVVTAPALFPVIQNFFRAQEAQFGHDVEIRNLPSRDSKSLVIDFLIALAHFVWGWERHELPTFGTKEQKTEAELYNMTTQDRLDASKPWLVEVLSKLIRLDVIKRWEWQLDAPCLEKLREIAMRAELKQHYHPVAKDRLVESLDEACYAGSREAWFLKELELKRRERDRLKRILEAQEELATVQQKIKELTRPK